MEKTTAKGAQNGYGKGGTALRGIKRTFFGAVFIFIAVVISSCSLNGDDGSDNQGTVENTTINAEDNGTDGVSESSGVVVYEDNSKMIYDKDTLYENQDPSSVVTMYLTVSEGSASDNTNHTWTQVNSYSVYDYEYMGVDRYSVNGLLQVGDENGPLEGELGYGQNVPNATVTIRGQSSSRNKQKNYKITIRDNKGTWNDQKVINLNKHVSDYSRFSNKLCYDLMTQLPDMISLRTQFVHLYVKDMTEGGSGQFEDYGLYTQVEQLNKRALKSHGLDNNGQLYKVNFFEFYKYPDVIMLKNDADYNVEAFEEMLEIKGSDDHSKLIAMLGDVNDYSVPIDEVMDKWFCEDNLFSWMAFHILMGNIDTQSRNVFLYSPLNSNTWYFISWDNDGAFSSSKNVRNNVVTGWETGVSNYWGNVLFKRILLDKGMRQKLDEKIEEYAKIINEEKLSELINIYAPVVEQYSFKEPDLEYMSLGIDSYKEFLKLMTGETQRNYALYKESLKKPMPFYIGKPQYDGQKLKITWDSSYDFEAENIYYSVEIAKDYSFENPLLKVDNLYVTECTADITLEPGQYFMRIKAKNESGMEQTAFDYYISNRNGRIYGVKSFFVMPDGTIEEDVYEE